MQRRTLLMGGMAVVLLALVAPKFYFRTAQAGAIAPDAAALRFESMDGGTLDLAQFRGGPVLVVNTASHCGFVKQFDGLQALHDRYHARGLTVVGVPSNSFRQELGSNAAVKDFCETNFNITFPMTTLVSVRGADAHPFYAWAREQGVVPNWNFTKILLDSNGAIIDSYGPLTAPDSRSLTQAIEAQLPSA